MEKEERELKTYLETPMKDEELFSEVLLFLNHYFQLTEHPFTKQDIDTLSNFSLALKLDMMLWHSLSPNNSTDKTLFYRNTPFEFLKNLLKNMDGMHFKILNHMITRIEYYQARTILDYGGGSGYFALQLYFHGYEVSFAEINKLSLAWMRYITSKNSIGIKIIDLYEDKLSEVYDMVIIKDVLEHVDNPNELIKSIIPFSKELTILPDQCPGQEDWLPMHKKYTQDDVIKDLPLKPLLIGSNGKESEIESKS